MKPVNNLLTTIRKKIGKNKKNSVKNESEAIKTFSYEVKSTIRFT